MKRREYLRGIGIGILTASIIFAVVNKVNELSDEDIIKRSIELGAVYETANPFLATVAPSETPEPTKSPEPTATPEPVTTVAPTDTPEPVKTPEPTKSPEPTVTPESTIVPTTEVGDTNNASVYKLTIVRGQGSNIVADNLEKAGVIDSAKDFDKYLVDNKIDSKIRVGIYEIPINSSWEDIVKMIAG